MTGAPSAAADVIVVGAGLAGLTAAGELRRHGLDVLVLEAGGRPGGRVRTVRAPFAAGQHVESGAEWVDSVHRRMHALMDRFGVELEGEGQTWGLVRRWLHLDGELLDPAGLAARVPTLRAELARYEEIAQRDLDRCDPEHPDRHPDAAAIDARSLAEAIDEADLGPVARLFATRDAQGEFAAEPGEVSLLSLLQQRALYRVAAGEGRSVARAHRVVGGLDRITAGLAAGIGPALRLAEPVVGIGHGDTLEVRTPSAVYRAGHVVVSCSLIPLRRIAFDPPLPSPLAAAVAGLGYGTVTKTALQYTRRWWPAGYATTESPIQRVYEPTVDQPGPPGVLMAYTGGAGGHRLAESTEAERMDLVGGQQRAVYRCTGAPDADAPVTGFSRAWSAEARFGGSYSNYRPGEVTAYWDVLRRPAGRIHLAGEHVATWTGYMEGAVESGETVAARIAGSGS